MKKQIEEQSLESLYNYTYDGLKELVQDYGWKPFRGHQIFQWLYREMASDIDEMTNISKENRQLLKEHYFIEPLHLLDYQVSKDGTTKFLFETQDHCTLESVLMVFDYGNSVCVSTQIGCNMGCDFCASGLTKKKRDCTSAEMVAQVMYVQRYLSERQQRLSHIVVMGTGEPFDNYTNVMNFLETVNHDCGLGIGSRHITISTCGIVPKIYEFADARKQYNLAISLHAPNDALRSRLMPINQAYPLDTLMKAIDYYCHLNNRRLTFEYILLKGVNDKKEHAHQLAKLLKGYNAYVNLIPYNSVDEHGYQGVNHQQAMVFYDLLMKENIRCTIRKEHGQDIDAACGQLRIKQMKKGNRL